MGRVLRVLLTLVGLLLLAVGGAAAAYVGSDDTVFNQAADVGDDGRPVVTVPDLFAYDDLRLTVRASAPKGVFVGTANGVDIADYTKNAPYFELVGVSRTGVSGSEHDGKAKKLPTPPAFVDFWTAHASGAGTQTLSMKVDGAAPPRFVIVPVGGDGPTTVSFGATIDGLFLSTLAVAGAGLLLILLAVGWVLFSRWRRRRRARRVGPTMPAPNIPKAPIYRRLAVPVVLSGLLVTSGCGTLPKHVAYQPPSKVALTAAELPALWKSLDRRQKAAARAAGPKKYDSSKWSRALSGPVLDAAVRNTMYDELTKAKKGTKVRHHTGLLVYAGAFDSYPMWALVTAKAPLKKGESNDDRVNLALITRESSTSPWLWHSQMDVIQSHVPPPAEPTPVPVEVTKKAKTLAASLMHYWRTEDLPSDMTMSTEAEAPVEWAHSEEKKDYVGSARIKPAFYGGKDGLPRIVRATGGYLAVTDFTLTTALKAEDGATIYWKTPYDQLNDTIGSSKLTSEVVVSTVMLIPDNGGLATVLGTSIDNVLSYGG